MSNISTLRRLAEQQGYRLEVKGERTGGQM